MLLKFFFVIMMLSLRKCQREETSISSSPIVNPLTREQPDSPLHRHPIANTVLNALQSFWKLGWKGYQDYPNSVHSITGDPDFFNHETATVAPIVQPGLPSDQSIEMNPFFSSDTRVQSFLIERSYGPWMQILTQDNSWSHEDA
jgi:hypothetical protein